MTRFERALNAACDRHKVWALTEAEFGWLSTMPCEYCCRPTGDGIGLDRLERWRGYELDNVVPACGRCNKARGFSFTPGEFHRIVELLDWKLTPASGH